MLLRFLSALSFQSGFPLPLFLTEQAENAFFLRV